MYAYPIECTQEKMIMCYSMHIHLKTCFYKQQYIGSDLNTENHAIVHIVSSEITISTNQNGIEDQLDFSEDRDLWKDRDIQKMPV